MENKMVYLGLQLKDMEEVQKVEKMLENLGINSFTNYKYNQSGVYGLGMKQKYLVELSEFSLEELEQEIRNRG